MACRNVVPFGLVLVVSGMARATTISPIPWEELVSKADLVGVVECTIAGGIVAEYTVVDSWRGPPTGTKVRLRLGVEYWGTHYPVTLVGERFLVTAFKQAPGNMASTSGGGAVPLWARRIPADYGLPLWQGRIPLPISRPITLFGTSHAHVESLKRAVLAHYSLNPADSEVRRIRSLAIQDLEEHAKPIEGEENLDRILDELTAILRSKGTESHYRYRIASLLSSAGGERTRRYVSENWTEPELAEFRDKILESLDEKDEPPRDPPKSRPGPTPSEIAEAQKALTSSTAELHHIGHAVFVLSSPEPGAVASYLSHFRADLRFGWRGQNSGYQLGSTLGLLCRTDCATHLKSLANARDPWIRAAGAVYLTLWAPEFGVPALRNASRLPGDPGAWAALALARRGERESVPRLLEVFDVPATGGMAEINHLILQDRAMELFSNSAKGSALTPPPKWDRLAGTKAPNILAWWNANEAKINLVDPWYSILAEQKVD
ncbi:MAG: hypothetical protein HY791_34670 [Deltaproteobacteria bacterium]|nr:hypothetical protein [Deltaproteobacteria bacterium]